jgi:tRNA G18 (ribose-2'-O)-methylase SpoU
MPVGDRKLKNEELGRADLGSLAAMPRRPIRVVLDDVRSRHNVGSVFRTADAFRIDGLDLCGFTPVPPHREIEKTALGATLAVPWRHFGTALQAVERLRADGWTVVAVEQTRLAVPLEAFHPPPGARLAVVFGNELHGVSEAVVEACYQAVVLPQHGLKHSLNVSVCAGVVLWSLAGRVSLSGGLA